MMPKQVVLNTLLKALTAVEEAGEAKFIDVMRACNSPTTARKYLNYALHRGLIRVARQYRGRGRYPTKIYTLTQKGAKLLEVMRG